MKPKHQRLLFILFALIFGVAAILLIMNALQDKVVFFYSPSEVPSAMREQGKTFRLGGMVEKGSLQSIAGTDKITFTVTDYTQTVTVHYQGMPPSLFREGQGVVAEGAFDADGSFNAKTILAKHDENYMPPELKKSLDKSTLKEDKP